MVKSMLYPLAINLQQTRSAVTRFGVRPITNELQVSRVAHGMYTTIILLLQYGCSSSKEGRLSVLRIRSDCQHVPQLNERLLLQPKWHA